ncbi:MAG: ribosomal-processing cysteine protease Prp [Lachnospiraceae bacterium]|nr:ribosomal-processing cysteine protease Prp [Lachnospiraceae bacterium]
MTTIIIGKDRNGAYKEITCLGHTGYAASGKDIVCASVSVLVINTINALEELAGEHFITTVREEEGYIQCKFDGPMQEKSVFLLDAMVYGLKNIRKEYGKKYLQVQFKEV